MCLGDVDGAQADALKGLASDDLDQSQHAYLVILASGWQRERGKLDEAKKLLSDAKLGPGDGWPAPVVRFLRGELTWEKLQPEAGSDAERTEAHVYAGWLDLTEGRSEAGRTHLQWAVDRGNRSVLDEQRVSVGSPAFTRSGPPEGGTPNCCWQRTG